MKNILRITAGTLVLASAGSFVATSQPATGYSTIGGSLGLNQRDFKIYDNFSASRLHNNNTAHDNWPGFTQVELAAWKGGAEWNSIAHGDGSGDGVQGNVGNGGANFDFFWSGNAAGAGNSNSNTIASIGGSSGGVLAYMQGPISDGWTIKFYGDAWNWFDGPGTESGVCFQGVATHELGHALGLGHSGVGGATMLPSISGNGTSARSINGDDQAGVQHIYGVASAGKPTIDSASGTFAVGGTVVLTGSNFSTSGNDVWLNDSGTNANPTKVTNVNSTAGGSQISFTVPSGAGLDGGVHVQDSGSGGSALSESHPFGDGPPPPTEDFFVLDGPGAILGGSIATLNISQAPSNRPYWIYVSLSDSGTTVINGQQFDIGPIKKTLNTGTTNGSGAASWTSGPAPNRFAGRTFYLEARVDDAGGNTLDSNLEPLLIV